MILLLAGCVRRTPGRVVPTLLAISPTPTGAASAGTISIASPAYPTPTPTRPTSTSLPGPSPTPAGPTPTPALETYNRQAWSETSPYGGWQAIFVAAYPEGQDGSPLGDQYHVRVKVVNLVSGQTNPILDEWRPYGLGYTIPHALLWSNDGRYLFLAETGNADGSGERFYQELQRLDLENGNLENLDLPGGPGESISPDGNRLARIDGDKLALIEIETGQKDELIFDLPRVEWRASQIYWSPQSEAILFTVRLNPFAQLDEMSSSLYLADLQAGQVRTLIENDRRRFSIRSFPTKTAALLSDLEARDWWLSLPDGRVQTGPPDDIALASQALRSYFNALQAGYYQEAVLWYGGTYEPLQTINPDISPEDRARLFERACTLNGYNCLSLDSLMLEQVTQAGRYLFEVSFTDPEGNLFVLHPCCGADLEIQPPAWLFQFSVQPDANGRYKLLELPVYSP